MKVVDHEDQMWFLFEYQGALFLDASCNHSFLGYTYMIELNEQELTAYESGGHRYLSELAHDIHYSAPIVKGSNSIYKGRDVTKQYSELVSAAVQQWREQRSGH
ncbi:hypothetical protein [Marinobacter sediminum]|uniref:hypothetical protein n=1 Tax=Marinobacter sediminum TaxID=256323 RepID=UPI00193AA50A|nr:hypothetical protein [Marinobacter sediminum]